MATGEEVVYELIVSNRGTKEADNVEVFAYFSPGIEPVSVEGGEAKIAAGDGLVEFAPLGSLPAGAKWCSGCRPRPIGPAAMCSAAK